jgi:hypothetical protein
MTPPVTPPVSPPGGDTVSPSISIQSPGFTIASTTLASIAISGTAADNVAVADVQWSTSGGDFGMATGTTVWTATVPLLVGTNVVTLRAYDAAGNSGWRAMTIVRH